MFSKLLVPLTALTAIAYAAPATPIVRSALVDSITTFQPAFKSSFSPLDGKLISAVNGGFFIGKEPTISCDPSHAPCGYFKNLTTIALSHDNHTGTLPVFVTYVTGGTQSIHIKPTGELAYTAPGVAVPEGSKSGPFTLQNTWDPPTGNTYIAIYYTDFWMACPTEEADLYQIFAGTPSKNPQCDVFNMVPNPSYVTDPFPSAYEYSV